MTLIQAQAASVAWDQSKKRWTLTIHIGAEVIKRSLEPSPVHEADDDALATLAVDMAKDEGYELRPETVKVAR